jgi:hypothetical protein
MARLVDLTALRNLTPEAVAVVQIVDWRTRLPFACRNDVHLNGPKAKWVVVGVSGGWIA